MELEEVNTEETRVRKVLSLFPFIVVNHSFTDKKLSDFVWTSKWFKFVEVTERKTTVRFQQFDDGWSYQFYWGPWKDRWVFVKLNK